MLGLLAPTLVAIGAACALGGTLRNLLYIRVRGWPAIVVAFAIELVLYNPPVDGQAWANAVGPWLWVATKLVLLGVVLLNARDAAQRWPWLVVGAGLALNTLVIVSNGGFMPQSVDAAAAVWGQRTLDPARLHNVMPIGPQTQLVWLADVLPEPRWLPRANVLSVGDLLLAAGVAAWAFVATKPTIRFSIDSLGISWSEAPLHGDARSSRRIST